MKNGAKKIIAVGLGVCFFALWFVFLFFGTKSYTEKIVIWLPDNYELENYVKDEVVSIMPNFDESLHRSNSVFYTMIDLDSLKELAGKSENASVRIEDASHHGDEKYRIVYQVGYSVDNNNKSLFVIAQECRNYRKTILSEMRLSQNTLFLKYNRNTMAMLFFSILGFVAIAFFVYISFLCIDICSRQSND